MHLLKENPSEISVPDLSCNDIWNEDIIEPFKEELIQRCFHPDRQIRY